MRTALKRSAIDSIQGLNVTARTVSVVIPTYNRSSYIGTCLEHVIGQTTRPVEIVVVDASEGDDTASVASNHPAVIYIRSPHGIGTTATSRALGLDVVTADVVAFLDDDAYPQPNWLENLMKRYNDPSVAGVGGRTINRQPEEEWEGIDQVGRLLDDGTLLGHFSAVTPNDLYVDHLLGANMSLRCDVIRELGGIRHFYPGTCLREKSDIALRARKAGYRLVYTPEAVVLHVGETYAKGHRFDRRYEYYAARNHAVLPWTALGPNDPRARANPRAATRKVSGHVDYALRSLAAVPGGSSNRIRGAADGLSRAVVSLSGAVVGHAVAFSKLRELSKSESTSCAWDGR